MAIVNGKRLYNSGKLQAVSLEDDRAAAEYSWLMSGISDDFGRFKMSPRRILGKAYDGRPGVNELMVADWLALFEKHGLIRLYMVGATTYAEWTNYMGDPPSQRRFHSCPEPEWTSHKHNKRCTFRDDVAGMQVGRRLGMQRPTHLPTAPLSSVPSVPSVPSEQKTTDPVATAPAPKNLGVQLATTDHGPVLVVAPLPWNGEAAELWTLEYRGPPPKQFFAALKPLVKREGWERVRPALVTYMAETPAEYVNIAGKFVAAFGTWEARSRGQPAKRKETVADRSRRVLGLPPISGGPDDFGANVSLGTSQPERRLQSGGESGRGEAVSEGLGGTDRGGIPGGRA